MDIYTLCAVIGGTLFLCQLVLSLFGIGHDHDFGGADHDAVSHDGAGERGGHGWSQFGHGMFSFRALVVGVTLFGLVGRAANESSLGTGLVLLVSVGAGIMGLAVMALIMQALNKLEAEGNLRIEQALVQRATVYLTIPAHKSGPGKITANVQNRSLEFQAMTEGDALPTGTLVEVIDLLEGEMLLVAALPGDKEGAPDAETAKSKSHKRGGRNA